ncbi:hypothetical protein M514_07145 [Trichuris suis]|uniref:WAP domain-containing protein n=1 Tax=Trichuris suis TaxID=68888 RepID=A0A085NPH5_9BILA|nr:hypothetical protein M513_07145 [Trichuris suis]KFD71371.1 hypothetical protein M514_07145 [Trichuris suis]
MTGTFSIFISVALCLVQATAGLPQQYIHDARSSSRLEVISVETKTLGRRRPITVGVLAWGESTSSKSLEHARTRGPERCPPLKTQEKEERDLRCHCPHGKQCCLTSSGPTCVDVPSRLEVTDKETNGDSARCIVTLAFMAKPGQPCESDNECTGGRKCCSSRLGKRCGTPSRQ